MEGRVSYLCVVRRALGGRVNRVAEVGVLRGRYSANLLTELQPRDLMLIDPWRVQPTDPFYRTDSAAVWEARYAAVVRKFGKDRRVRIIRDLSVAVARTVEACSLDLVYLDADHSEKAVLEDLRAWSPKVRRGGFLAGHDFSVPSVRAACQQFFGEQRFARLVSPPEPGHGHSLFPPSFFYQVL